jgi:hypothetical protein
MPSTEIPYSLTGTEAPHLEVVSKIPRRENDDIWGDARKPPDRTRRWPFRPLSTREKDDEADSRIASFAAEVFLKPLLGRVATIIK